MSVKSACEIALYCQSIDPDWNKEVSEPSQVEARLNKLAVLTIRCGALFFKKVHLHKQNHAEYSSICIGNNPLSISVARRYFGLSDDETLFTLSQPKINFYLLYQNKIYRVEMSKEDNTIVSMPTPQNSFWNTSASKIKAMVGKDWSNSFITACHFWNSVIPLNM